MHMARGNPYCDLIGPYQIVVMSRIHIIYRCPQTFPFLCEGLACNTKSQEHMQCFVIEHREPNSLIHMPTLK